MKRGIAFGVLIVAALALYQLGVGRGVGSSSAPTSASHPGLDEQGSALLLALPLSFIENHGQWDSSVRFITHKGGLTAWFEQDAITLQLAKRQGKDEPSGAVLRLAFEGASKAVTLEGETRQPGTHNYFLGSDPAKWRTDVPGYAQVLYRGLYDGIDLQVKEHEGRLEYDLLLKPDAELEQVAIRAEGVQSLELDEDGSLLMHTALGAIHQPLPSAWHELASGQRQPVETRFVLLDETRYGFEAPKRNRQLALLIDPGLTYSSYLGGNQYDYGTGIALDASGNAYLTGYTTSPNFPTTPGSYDTTCGTDGQCNYGQNSYRADAFVTKVNPTGSAMLYSTFLGGSSFEYGEDIAVDSAGNAYVAGNTYSSDFPTTPGAYNTTQSTTWRPFITKLNSQGNALAYSTFVNDRSTHARGIDVDVSGNAYVTGWISVYGNFPTTPGAIQPTFGGGANDAFILKLNPQGSALVYATYLGGGHTPKNGFSDEGGEAITVDRAGNAYVAGYTSSPNFPTTPGAYDTTCGTDGQCNYNGQIYYHDGFVAKLNPTGTALIYSSFIGGSNHDVFDHMVSTRRGAGLAVDSSGNAFLTGLTISANFPTTPGAYDTTCGTDGQCNYGQYGYEADAFVTKLNPTGTALIYSTFLGGSSEDISYSLDVDTAGHAYVTGWAGIAFPTTPGAYRQGSYGDVFITKLNAVGSSLLYSTSLGGNYTYEQGYGIAVDLFGNAHLTGHVGTQFPTTAGAFQPTPGGPYDAFVTKLDLLPTGANPYGASTSGGTGNCPGPITMGVNQMPQAGAATFALTAMNASPNTTGFLGIAGGPPPTTPTPAAGINIWLNLSQLALLIPVTTNSLGAVSVTVPIPPGTAGALVHTQMVFFNTAACGGSATLSASNGLGLLIQP